MARGATLPAAAGMMIKRLRLRHLPALRHAGPNLMARVAVGLVVFIVAEAYAKRLGKLRCAGVTAQRMARTAGRNVAASGLGPVRMTAVTGVMCAEAAGNRHRHACAHRSMTRSAFNAAHIQVTRMIKIHAKAAQPGERFQRSGLSVRVTDGTDRTIRLRKLLRVTARARQMVRSARAFGHRGIVIPAMAEQARQARMIGIAVLEL